MGITQCGINPGQSFTYSFIAEEEGTRWYHGHSGGIRMDGVYGAIIVHPTLPSSSKVTMLMTNTTDIYLIF